MDGWEDWDGGPRAQPQPQPEPEAEARPAGELHAQLLGDDPFGSTPAEPVAPADPPGTRRKLVTLGVVAVLVAGGIAVAVVAATAGRGHLSKQALVSAAVSATTSRKTADVEISGDVVVAGQSVPISGSGVAQFGPHGGLECSIVASVSGHPFTEQEFALGGRFYLAMRLDGRDLVGSFMAGRHWLEVPLPAGSGSGIGAGAEVDPLAQLQLLAKRQGYSVARAGTTTIDGDRVTGYRIRVSPAVLALQERHAIAALHLPAALQSILSRNEAASYSRFSFVVYIDGQNLMRRIAVTIGSTSQSTSGQVNVTFTHFGAPVFLHAPSPGEVLSFTQYMHLLLGGLGQSASAPGSAFGG